MREQIEAVEDELDRLDRAPESTDRRMSSKSNVARREALIADLEALYKSAEDTTLYVVVEAMQRSVYRALVDAHPPRKDGDGKPIPEDRHGVNVDTFPPELIRASIVGYKQSPDVADTDVTLFPPPKDAKDGEITVDWLLEFLTDRQIEVLGTACVQLNRGDDAVPLRRRRSTTRTSDVE